MRFGSAVSVLKLAWHGICKHLALLKTVQQPHCAVERDSRRLSDEFIVFSACLVIIGSLRALADKFADGEITGLTFINQAQALLSRLRRTAEATQRFDLVLPVIDSDTFSPFFWQWFNWWLDYSVALTPAQFQRIAKPARRPRKSGLKRRPEGDWLGYRRTPALLVQMGTGNKPAPGVQSMQLLQSPNAVAHPHPGYSLSGSSQSSRS